jgi:predicted Abi (CAAX) family protease
MIDYLRQNLWKGIRASPFHGTLKAWALVPLLAMIAAAAGIPTGLFKFQLLRSEVAPLLPFTLFIFPSLLEEIVFRGVLIPRDILETGGTARSTGIILLSTTAFVLWHPLNALAFNHSAIPLFTDPWFLVIVTALGITCSYGYIRSKSIWVPVFIHWTTVTIWVLFLGGRNLVLEM